MMSTSRQLNDTYYASSGRKTLSLHSMVMDGEMLYMQRHTKCKHFYSTYHCIIKSTTVMESISQEIDDIMNFSCSDFAH